MIWDFWALNHAETIINVLSDLRKVENDSQSNFYILTLGLGVNPRVRIWDLRALGQLETIINEVSDPKLVERVGICMF